MAEKKTDKKQIGLTALANDHIKRLKYNEDKLDGSFKEEADAFKFAVAFALRSGQMAEPTIQTYTKWNVAGSLDEDGSLGDVIELFFPEECQEHGRNRIMERLGEWGIHEIVKIINSEEPNIAKIISSFDNDN